MPDPLDGREADNWSPLLAIADAAGGGWPERARRAACELGGGVRDDDDARVTLVGDLLDLFDARGDRIASDDLVTALRRMDARPWPEWRDGKPISARGVAALLKPFGIEPRDLRLADGRRLKGYERVWFEDVWSRYLSSYPRQARQYSSEAVSAHDANPRHDDHVAEADAEPNPSSHGVVADVADPAVGDCAPCHQTKSAHPVTSPLAEFLNTELLASRMHHE